MLTPPPSPPLLNFSIICISLLVNWKWGGIVFLPQQPIYTYATWQLAGRIWEREKKFVWIVSITRILDNCLCEPLLFLVVIIIKLFLLPPYRCVDLKIMNYGTVPCWPARSQLSKTLRTSSDRPLVPKLFIFSIYFNPTDHVRHGGHGGRGRGQGAEGGWTLKIT